MQRVLPLLFVVAPVFAGVQEQWWNITYVHDVNPDGLYPRQVIGVNGTWPLPAVNVNSSDSFILHVTNSLDQPTTVHHHGMFFNGTPWFDGTTGVTQCGIPPGAQFDYIVPINESGQIGTYWSHSHFGGQYIDGLRTSVVIHPETEKYTYDAEYTVVLSEWYHEQSSVLLKKFISIANPGGAEPIPNSAIMYFGQYDKWLGPISGTNPDPVTAAVGFNENATLPFEPGKTYRLRLINVGGFAAQYFWIDGHEMRIIEVDGTDVEEYPADMLEITVAQRYSILVTARNDTSSNWAVHARMDTVMFDKVPPGLNPNVTSSITYNSSALITNLSPVYNLTNIEDTNLVPLNVIGMQPADYTIAVEFVFDTMDDGTNHAMFNGTTYNPPLVPAVFSELSLGDNATVAEAYGPLTFVLDHLSVVDIVLMNGDTGKHPFHMHGHQFQIVNRATNYLSDDPELNPPINESQLNPVRRDTVQVMGGSSVTLRFIADNPGVWFFHCHIEWHLEVGLALQLVEAPLIAQERSQVPQFMNDQCQALGMPYSGNAAGHTSATDLSGLPLGPYPQNNGWHSRGIGAMAGCVLTAVIGMATVVWYALGGNISDEELEYEVRLHQEEKEKRGRFFGLIKRRQAGGSD
ncbi:Fet3 protein [Sparassis latifolia]